MPTQNSSADSDQRGFRLSGRLFVAGDAPNSRAARRNLSLWIERLGVGACEVEIVDVSVDPQAALDHGVYVTPALQILEPGPKTVIFGNLSDEESLKTVFPEVGA